MKNARTQELAAEAFERWLTAREKLLDAQKSVEYFERELKRAEAEWQRILTLSNEQVDA